MRDVVATLVMTIVLAAFFAVVLAWFSLAALS